MDLDQRLAKPVKDQIVLFIFYFFSHKSLSQLLSSFTIAVRKQRIHK